ncbi:hypothetical protein QYE76_036472 [Lolium multiflorum]|uniref:Uncharacterized protein n=1 Tax=Lolium multiflorum TaxID=4521 RepID=A0AAD8VN47_LOLMU|nr:hypothetical protein QYE76_036472 [Lolium multiflorum]
MKHLLPRIRASYSDEISMPLSLRARCDNKVAEMVLKYGYFILHRLLKYARRAKMEEADDGNDRFGEDDEDWTQVYGRCFVWQFVTRDLLLLENQIPFFVIRELFQQLRNEDESEELLSGELLSELPQWIPCAKELKEAGIRFKMRKNATSFLDIKHTTYAFFMNCLITPPEDMRILGLRGILVNHLNSRRSIAWRFFSDIVAQVHWSADNYLVGIMGAVNKYRDSRRHKWRAALVRNYFTNPWVIMSVLAALLLLALAVLQSFFTVYRHFKPPNPE